MFEEVLKNSVAPVVIAALFLWFMDRAEKQRITNAKSMEKERQQHENTVFNMFASTMKQMIENVTASNERVIASLANHEQASQERYERMGNTQEILRKLDEMKKERAGAS